MGTEGNQLVMDCDPKKHTYLRMGSVCRKDNTCLCFMREVIAAVRTKTELRKHSEK